MLWKVTCKNFIRKFYHFQGHLMLIINFINRSQAVNLEAEFLCCVWKKKKKLKLSSWMCTWRTSLKTLLSAIWANQRLYILAETALPALSGWKDKAKPLSETVWGNITQRASSWAFETSTICSSVTAVGRIGWVNSHAGGDTIPPVRARRNDRRRRKVEVCEMRYNGCGLDCSWVIMRVCVSFLCVKVTGML